MTKMTTLRQTAVVECPKSMVGRVIGKGGETIKALQQYTGAMIQIDQSEDPTKVTIAGSPESLQLAVSMVSDIVNGHFKGFALLRQLSTKPGTQELVQPQPVYVEGYGFVPLSQGPHSQSCPDDALRHITAADILSLAGQHEQVRQGLRTTNLPEQHTLQLGELNVGGYPLKQNSTPFPDTHALHDPFLARLASGMYAGPAAAVGTSTSRAQLPTFTGGYEALEHQLFASDAKLGPVYKSCLEGASDTFTVELPRLTTSYGLSPPTSPTLSSPQSLPIGWMHIADPDGRMFYYNQLNGRAQWSSPV